MRRQALTSLGRLRLREHQLFLALTIVVGILAGLSAVLFTVAIDWTTHLFFGFDPSPFRLVGVPTGVSFVTGFLLLKVFPGVRGSGIPQTEAAVHVHEGVIPRYVPAGKFLTGVLCIGSGHSMGREGPSVQIGAGIASVIGQWLRLSPSRLKDLVPVGAAGALAAAFNTPIAAVLFALEEIMGDLNAPLLGATVVASVASVVVERSILGNQPLFHVPPYHLEHPAELIAYAVLGIAGGIVSLIFSKGLLGLRGLFRRLPSRTLIVQPAMGGLAIGLLLLVAPEIMGVGYEYVDRALNGGLVFRTMAILCGLKLAATLISYSSGNAGGIFGPSLYIGSMAGGAIGSIVHQVAPFPTADPGAYALVGMGAVFAGIVRAPMTSVFMIFEITQDYEILVPLMVANLLSFMIARRFQPEPIYHALLHQDGVHLPPPGGRNVAGAWTAGEAMTQPAGFVAPDLPIKSAWESTLAAAGQGVMVGSPSELLGVVPISRLAEAMESGDPMAPVGSLVRGELVHVHPDHTPDVVLERVAEGGGILPVVRRESVKEVVGLITLDGLARFMSRRT
jgi:CIC family chloride channel protein